MDPLIIALEPAGVEIPAGIRDLASFRQWLRSPEFPERGRIDWLRGRMEVDMAPEDLETHGAPKSTIGSRLVALLQERRLGRVYIDRARLACPGSDLGVEPDVLVVLLESLRAGRIRLIPKVSGEAGQYLEVEGSADLIVEVVSNSSVRKDTVRLREFYHAAGVREYWIVDARRDPPALDLLMYRPETYEASPVTADGFRRSEVLGAEVRLVREAEEAGLIFYRLDVR